MLLLLAILLAAIRCTVQKVEVPLYPESVAPLKDPNAFTVAAEFDFRFLEANFADIAKIASRIALPRIVTLAGGRAEGMLGFAGLTFFIHNVTISAFESLLPPQFAPARDNTALAVSLKGCALAGEVQYVLDSKLGSKLGGSSYFRVRNLSIAFHLQLVPSLDLIGRPVLEFDPLSPPDIYSLGDFSTMLNLAWTSSVLSLHSAVNFVRDWAISNFLSVELPAQRANLIGLHRLVNKLANTYLQSFIGSTFFSAIDEMRVSQVSLGFRGDEKLTVHLELPAYRDAALHLWIDSAGIVSQRSLEASLPPADSTYSHLEQERLHREQYRTHLLQVKEYTERKSALLAHMDEKLAAMRRHLELLLKELASTRETDGDSLPAERLATAFEGWGSALEQRLSYFTKKLFPPLEEPNLGVAFLQRGGTVDKRKSQWDMDLLALVTNLQKQEEAHSDGVKEQLASHYSAVEIFHDALEEEEAYRPDFSLLEQTNTAQWLQLAVQEMTRSARRPPVFKVV